jgi:hypothetical protein
MSKNYNFFKFKSYFLIVSLLFFSKAFSANWYVNDNSTTGDVYCTAVGNNSNNGNSPATPKLTLLAAYTAAAAGDTIFIDTGTYSGAGNINLTVAKANLTFTGAGSLKTVFDNNLASANSNLWLTINANNININGISATEFNAISAGKVVTVNGQTVTFNDVIFFNNGNQGNGAIYITSNSNVTYSNSSTTCNASLLFGGGIDLVGNNSVLNITNCIIATNKKEDNGDGGGVLVKGNGNNVTITNTRFEKNDAVNGGAICIMGGTSAAPNLVTITGSCFENNKVSQVSSVVNGSAICIGRGGSTVFKKLSPKTKIIGVEPEGAPSMHQAIYLEQPVLLDKIDRFVDGAAVKKVGKQTYEVCKDTLDKIILVPEGKVCTTILQLYNEEAMVVEPAGALSIAALDFIADEIKGKKVVCIVSGSNNDIERTEEIKERSLMYEGLKHYFMIQFPQRPGALREFVNEVLSESDDITYFQFIKKNNRDVGPVVVGLEVKNENDVQSIKLKMNEKGFQFEYLNENDPLLALLI